MPVKKKTDFVFEELTVDVTAAYPLSEEQKKRLIRLIGEKLKIKTVHLNIKIDTHLLSGFQLQIGSSLIDVSVKRKLSLLQKALQDVSLANLSKEAFEALLKRLLQEEKMQPRVEQVGRVVSVKDGIARVAGMRATRAGELIDFPGELQGIVFNLNPEFSDIVMLGDDSRLEEGDLAVQTGNVVTVPVGKALIGRVVDALGHPIDGEGDLNTDLSMPLEVPSPGIVDRQSVKKPFQTGIKVVDALVPIGLGQRELIVGDRQTGKTSLIIDSIIAQKERNALASKPEEKLYCIYVAIGQKLSTVADVVRTLQNFGAMDYTTVVSASASDSASLQYLAPFTGCTIGEYFRDHKMNAVVFYDDLSKHANAYRQISLLLRRPPGREAYPGDIFYLHSRLLERAAMMSDDKGGGSLTAIPVVETQEGDVSAYIPTNVISITDGQIFLENSLFHEGVRPAVNVGLSVSRVGSKAQRPLLAKIASSLKLDLAQYREMLSFAQIASDLDVSSQNMLKKGVRITEMMKQKLHHPLSFEQEFVSIYAAVKGFLALLEPADILKFEEELLEHLQLEEPDLINEIGKATALDGRLEKRLGSVIKEFVQTFIEKKNQK